MNKQKMLATLQQGFMLKRYKAQEETEEFISELRQDEEFNKLYSNLTRKQLDYSKAELNEEILALKHDIDDLKLQINSYLVKNNIDKSKLTPNYDCKICNDTGVAGGRICKCLLNALNLKMSQQLSSAREFKCFDNCDK